MSMLLLSSLVVSLVAALLSVVGGLRAARASAACSMLASKLQSKLKDCDAAILRVTELDDLCAATQRSVAKLRSRAGMRELRDGDADERRLQGAEWKESMRAKMQLALSRKPG